MLVFFSKKEIGDKSTAVAIAGKDKKTVIYLCTTMGSISKVDKMREWLYANSKIDEDMFDDIYNEFSTHFRGVKGKATFQRIKNYLKMVDDGPKGLRLPKNISQDDIDKVKSAILGRSLIYVSDRKNNMSIFPKEPIANVEREIIFVAGSSGSGKSFHCSVYADNFQKLYPQKNIYVISKIQDDPTFKFNYTFLSPEDLIEAKVEDFNNSLIIFDDCDTFGFDELKEVNRIKNDVLNLGRHYGINAIITSHRLTNYSQTKPILEECHYITTFPHGTSKKALRYLYETYLELSKEQIKKIARIPSRYISISTRCPRIMIHSRGCELLDT